MAVRFHKMHGLGNDFLIFDARSGGGAEGFSPDAATVRLLSERRRGIGCDQLILLCPSDRADLRIAIWNGDGSRAEACGNAFRCVAALTGVSSIETDAGLVAGEVAAHGVTISLPPPRFAWDSIPLAYPMDSSALPLAWDGLRRPAAVNVGNPHLVFFVAELDEQGLIDIGPTIEHDACFPERININVARIDGPSAITLRTFERGAGLTEACGTGASATAVEAIRSGRCTAPVTVTMRGGSLLIDWAPGGPIHMTGPATYVCTGEVAPEALGLTS